MNLKARPDRTYAVLVGIDTYASLRLPPLNGPALDACQHARWLRSTLERGSVSTIDRRP
ncbi:hypothetical protein ACFCYB_18090 [Streptomyces sp. NPDC056309]|uniref:hypothetical protein n=1 Tax=unclassified Streptomyces TaxID=2593676 RepID=UPI0035E01F5B